MDIQHLTGRIDPNHAPQQPKKPAPGRTADGHSFAEILRGKTKLEFSGHAIKRLKNRSIPMDRPSMKRLEEAVARAEQKGSTDSLVLDGDRAFLVNIPHKKVITAVDMMQLREKVFTNIDSTVLTNKNIK